MTFMSNNQRRFRSIESTILDLTSNGCATTIGSAEPPNIMHLIVKISPKKLSMPSASPHQQLLLTFNHNRGKHIIMQSCRNLHTWNTVSYVQASKHPEYETNTCKTIAMARLHARKTARRSKLNRRQRSLVGKIKSPRLMVHGHVSTWAKDYSTIVTQPFTQAVINGVKSAMLFGKRLGVVDTFQE